MNHFALALRETAFNAASEVAPLSVYAPSSVVLGVLRPGGLAVVQPVGKPGRVAPAHVGNGMIRRADHAVGVAAEAPLCAMPAMLRSVAIAGL